MSFYFLIFSSTYFIVEETRLFEGHVASETQCSLAVHRKYAIKLNCKVSETELLGGAEYCPFLLQCQSEKSIFWLKQGAEERQK